MRQLSPCANLEEETKILLVDSRVGSRHYAELLGSRAMLTRLESADVAFSGSGGLSVGVEVKKISDAVNCLYTGRLADGQIPLLRQSYDVSYLIVEGLYQPGPDGLLQIYKGELGKWGRWYDAHSGAKRLMYSAFVKWLSTLCIGGGIFLQHTLTPECTAALLIALEDWWMDDSHRSFDVMHTFEDAAALTRPTVLRRVAAQLPLIGWQRSSQVAKRFRTVAAMVEASEAEWMQINGVGRGIAKKVWGALHEES